MFPKVLRSGSFRWVLVICSFVVLGLAVTDRYLLHMLVMCFIFGTAAFGLNIVVGYLGELPFGWAAFWGLGAYGSALMTLKLGISPWVAMLLGAFVSVLGGIIIGYMVLRLTGPFFAIATLGLSQILYLVCNIWDSLTRGPMGLSEIPALSFLGTPIAGEKAYYFVAMVPAIFAIYVCYRFRNSTIGRAAVAIRENPALANSVGINIFKYKLIAFCIGVFFAGIAGSLYTFYFSSISPSMFGLYYSGITLVMIIVGGRGTLVGPLIGAFFFTLIPEYLRLAGNLRMVIFGVLLILFIMFMPEGIWPKLSSVVMNVRDRITRNKK